MAVLRLSGDDIGDVVSQAVSGEYWLCLPCHLVNKWLRNAVINTTLAICLIALSWLISLVLCLLNIITIIWLQRFSSEISGTMGLLKWWNELPWCPSWRHNQTLDELVPECREMCSLLAAVVEIYVLWTRLLKLPVSSVLGRDRYNCCISAGVSTKTENALVSAVIYGYYFVGLVC